MSYLKHKLDDLGKALAALEQGLLENPDDLQRDGAIQRFEFCFELSWKCIKQVAVEQGIDQISSPKRAIQEAFRQGWIVDERTWVQMLSDRNLAAHTYRKELAEDLFARLPEYYKVLQALYNRLATEVKK